MSCGAVDDMNPVSIRNSIPYMENLSGILQASSKCLSSQPTRFGLKLNFRIPSSNVVFFCFALSNLPGSSLFSGVAVLETSATEEGSGLSRAVSEDPLSNLTSSEGRGCVLGFTIGSATVLPAWVPHTTSDRKTATKHSKLCRFRLPSDRPEVLVSGAPGPGSALVVSDGGRAVRLDRWEGCKEGLVGSEIFSLGAEKCDVPNFEMIFIRLKL